MKNTEIAWAAGFWEGEGTCRGRAKITVEASAVQTCRDPLMKLQDLFGGSVWENKCVKKHNPNASRSYQWAVTGLKARAFLQAIRPYIVSKRRVRQIDEALACPMGTRSWWPDLPDKRAAIEKAIKLMMVPGRRNGNAVNKIAERFGVSTKVIYNIRTGRYAR